MSRAPIPSERESARPAARPRVRRPERVVGGPIGAAVGGVVGAVAGGAAGHAAGEAVNPTEEAAFWRDNYNKRPYYVTGKPYSEYEPAYRYGWESAARPEYRGRKFNEVEGDLEKGWDKAKGTTGRAWHDVKDATARRLGSDSKLGRSRSFRF